MASRRGHAGGIVGITLLAFATVGVLLLFGRFRSTSDLVASLSTANGAANLAGYFALVVVPAGLPAALAGAMRAATLIEREPPGRTFGFWALRGVGVGGILGAANAAVWFALINIGVAPMFIGGMMAVVGGGAGATVGFVVAVCCWRLTRVR